MKSLQFIMSILWGVLTVLWFVLWLTEFIDTGNANVAKLAATLACLALFKIDFKE